MIKWSEENKTTYVYMYYFVIVEMYRLPSTADWIWTNENIET